MTKEKVIKIDPGINYITDWVNDDGSFTIDNAQYLANASDGNYYGDFTFAGDGKYKECRYEGNVTVVAK